MRTPGQMPSAPTSSTCIQGCCLLCRHADASADSTACTANLPTSPGGVSLLLPSAAWIYRPTCSVGMEGGSHQPQTGLTKAARVTGPVPMRPRAPSFLGPCPSINHLVARAPADTGSAPKADLQPHPAYRQLLDLLNLQMVGTNVPAAAAVVPMDGSLCDVSPSNPPSHGMPYLPTSWPSRVSVRGSAFDLDLPPAFRTSPEMNRQSMSIRRPLVFLARASKRRDLERTFGQPPFPTGLSLLRHSDR